MTTVTDHITVLTFLLENERKDGVKCPRMLATVDNINFECLLDSGSDATLISESTFERVESNSCVKVGSVSNTYSTSALGKRSSKIEKQLYAQLKFENLLIDTILLVFGHLVCDVILGIDKIVENKVIINGKEKNNKIQKT